MKRKQNRLYTTLVITLIVCCALLVALIGYTVYLFLPSSQMEAQTPLPITPTSSLPPKPVLTVKTAPPKQDDTVSTYLVDMDTGNVLENHNGTKPMPMASTTKIMTALIALQTGDLNQLIPVHQDAYDHVIEMGSSSAQLQVGDTLTLKDMLYGLMLPSGGDAAIAIADALTDGHPQIFVERMNQFARRLHMFHTNYENVDGLTTSRTHYSSGADIITLTEYAMKNPVFREIVQTPKYTVPATEHNHAYAWVNTNKLLTSYTGMTGVKTGHTDVAGWCLVFSAKRNGHTLMGVILNSPTEEGRDASVRELLDWAFSQPSLPPSQAA